MSNCGSVVTCYPLSVVKILGLFCARKLHHKTQSEARLGRRFYDGMMAEVVSSAETSDTEVYCTVCMRARRQVVVRGLSDEPVELRRCREQPRHPPPASRRSSPPRPASRKSLQYSRRPTRFRRRRRPRRPCGSRRLR